ncbi:ATP-grasp domain-containing protein [Ferruginibacter albus]|uniref:ATP-grasp domain-containing protein n=1 Tax=Ferruginibacter albus TaxID=2875540 RepID=UPI001CC476D7|nr:ATP-grasp domain-containing protein [Ferruginibacter albus]UAY53051.1 ATP-grasp domain-containing protein [Ferruginibacter albus]
MNFLLKKWHMVQYHIRTFHPRLQKKRFYKKTAIESRNIPSLNILFSIRKDWEKNIRKGFSTTAHHIRFNTLSIENIIKSDVVIPLTIKDTQLLNRNRNIIEDNIIPIPSTNVLNICNNKQLFYQWLEENGFKEMCPKVGLPQQYPYILKKKITEWGIGSEIIYNKDMELRFKDQLLSNDYFVQQIIPGKTEYATHILFKNNKVASSLTFKHVHKTRIHLRGKQESSYSLMTQTPFLSLFSSILMKMEWQGICCIDYTIYKGKPYIFEINPRVGGSLTEFLFSFLIAAYDEDQLRLHTFSKRSSVEEVLIN